MIHLACLAPLACGLPEAAAPERAWTLLVYGAADNNADGPILEFLDRVRKAIDDDPGIELVLFLDRHAAYSDDARLLGEDFTGARLYRLRKDSAERLAGGELFPEIALDREYEADSADPESVRRFVAFGKARFPARKYGLLIYSHADGQTMCPDEERGHDMGIAALTDIVPEEQSVDFLALELCNMAGIEIAYQWRPGNGGFGADVLVAIPNAGPPLDWDRAFARIRSKGHASDAAEPWLDPAAMSAEDFGRLVVEEGERGRRARTRAGAEHESAGCYDLRRAAQVKAAVDALAAAVARTGGRAAFEALRGPSTSVVAMRFVGDEEIAERPYVDLYDLCARAAKCAELDASVRRAAESALEEIDRLVVASFGMPGYAGFQPGRNGIFIVFPFADPGGAKPWTTCGWYTPRTGEGGAYGRWTFLADGGTEGNGVVETWFELLDSWIDPDGHRW